MQTAARKHHSITLSHLLTLPLFTLWPCLSARDECSYVTCCFFSRCVPGWQLTMHLSELSLLLFFARAYAVLAYTRLLLFSQLIPWLTTHHATVSSQLTVFVARAYAALARALFSQSASLVGMVPWISVFLEMCHASVLANLKILPIFMNLLPGSG